MEKSKSFQKLKILIPPTQTFKDLESLEQGKKTHHYHHFQTIQVDGIADLSEKRFM